ncbi:TetR/AcrR family transcriptional regulator [Alicyclobacillus sp. SO9]|uniref:TetR/AcrR family transcriptional regulator n=1 Tax=Alicyclobacillus sp. SO9 TaxID=2665646 RepID=UPI0018E72D9E|nr:TetR/AcrR family transcriptional regulator [Alicyclobacillus sp. SO9]
MATADRSRILDAADRLFNTRGYRSVTMADLAAELGMSKKTLYLEFSGKAEIADEIVERMFGRIQHAIDESDFEDEPVQNLKVLIERIKDEVSHMQPIFFRDIQKDLPDLWHRITEFRAKRILAVTQTSIEKAQELGEIRALDARLTALILLEAVQSVVRPEFLSRYQYGTREVLDTLLNVFFHGVFST